MTASRNEIPDGSGTVRLADGRVVTLRRAAPDDAGRVQTFVRRLSPQARRERWFAPVSELAPRELARITAPRRDESLLALDANGDVVGLAEYVQEAGREAEFAVVVADDWRRVGFGAALVRRLIAAGARAGLGSLRALVMSGNSAMLGLASHLGFERRRDRDPGLVSLTLRI